MAFEGLYRKHYKILWLIPAILFVANVFIAFVYPGIKLGVDFRGGILVSFASDKPVPADKLAAAVKAATGVAEVTVVPTESFGTGPRYGGIVEVVYPENIKLVPESNVQTPQLTAGTGSELTADQFKQKVLEAIKKVVPDAQNIVIQDVTPAIGSTFWNKAMNMAIWAFVLMAISVFAFFRKGIPTAIMIGSAIFDLIGMLALMALFNIPLNLDTITILLMMVGYSIDTDIVLSTHLLKRTKSEEGDEFSRAARAATTGLHMSGTTLVAMLFILAVGYLTRNLAVMRVGAVMIFGVLADIVITWFLNAPVMITWVRKHASAA